MQTQPVLTSQSKGHNTAIIALYLRQTIDTGNKSNERMTIRGSNFTVLALFIFAVQDAVVKYLTKQSEVLEIFTRRILTVVLILGSMAPLFNYVK